MYANYKMNTAIKYSIYSKYWIIIQIKFIENKYNNRNNKNKKKENKTLLNQSIIKTEIIMLNTTK